MLKVSQNLLLSDSHSVNINIKRIAAQPCHNLFLFRYFQKFITNDYMSEGTVQLEQWLV